MPSAADNSTLEFFDNEVNIGDPDLEAHFEALDSQIQLKIKEMK